MRLLTCPAKIIEAPSNVKVVAGETALFFCRATGNPTPTVNFLLDQTISHPRFRASVTIPDGSLLRLTKTHRDQNGLQVQCVARNHVGGDSATAHLTVYDVNADLPEGYPVIHSAPRSTSAAVGDVSQLDCEVSGYPQPTVIWIKNEVPTPTNGPRITVVDTHSAPNIIDKANQIHVRPGHGANLTCRATGNPIPVTRWLTDRESPITESNEGTATLFVADITESTRYICEANNSLGTVQHPVRVFVIDVPSPPVNLTCLEEGAYHAFLRWFPPEIPQKFQHKDPSETTIDSYTLFLTESNNTNARTNRRQITGISAKQIHPDGALQYKIVDLKPYTIYTAEVTAINNLLGMSDPSNKIMFTTAEIAPGTTPLDVHAVAVTDDMVHVRWRSPSQPNGKIIRYTVLYSRDPRLPLNKWFRMETNTETVQIRDLKSSETYYVKVAASNSVDTGPFTEALPVIVKFGVPAQPVNLRGLSVSPKQIFLNWTAPMTANSVQLQDYLVRYRSAQTDYSNLDKPVEYTIPGALTQLLLDHLSPNVTYHISLAARTKYGVGVAAQIQVQTESNVPGLPILHELDILDSSRIRIRWLAPESPSASIDIEELPEQSAIYRPSAVKQFQLQWAAFPFTDWEEHNISAVHPPSSKYVYEYVIKGLLSRTRYSLRLAAFGSEGVGPALELNPVMTKGQDGLQSADLSVPFILDSNPCMLDPSICFQVPSAPRNLRLNQLRRALPPGIRDLKEAFAVLELAWDPPERSHGDLRGYQVSYRVIGPPDAIFSETLTSAGQLHETGLSKPVRRNVTQTAFTSSIADGIKFGRVYQFEVAAYNGVDLGLPAQLNVSTPENVPDGYPLQVRLNGQSATAVEVTWSPPVQQQWNGGIVNYQVRYFQPSSPNTTEVIRVTSEPRLVIENLEERTFYTVLVRAMTNNGPGPWSIPNTIQTTAELPDPPSQVIGIRINPRQIKVTWDTVPSGRKLHARVPITGFRIYYSKNMNEADLNSWKILDVGPVTMATLDELEPNSEYVIKIKSRGADKRYGRISEPIIVGTYIPDDTHLLGIGFPGGFKGVSEKRGVTHLSCHWIPALDTARQGEASLKLNWERSLESENVYQFQIQLLGTKSYIDENNQPRRVVFDPRTLEVSLSTLESSAPTSGYFPTSYMNPPLTEKQHPQYSLVIDELAANTVYDVQINPLYQTPSNLFGSGQSSFGGRTSCRTMMLPPLHVPRPVPVAAKQQTGQIVMRVFRVSENLGRIRRYYLILSKTSASLDFTSAPISQEVYWQNKLQETSQTWDPETFIAAEYSQEVFEEAQIELLLSSPNYSRHRRSTDGSISNRPNETRKSHESYQSDRPISFDPDILVYGRQLIRDQEYKAFVLACIYPNSEETVYQPSSLSGEVQIGLDPPNKLLYPKDFNEQTNSPANLCTASTWSVGFSPNKLIISPDSEASSQSSLDEGKGGVFGPLAPPKTQATANTDMFTVSLIAVIVGLGLMAVICITVGCVVRRRKPKTLKDDMTIDLGNTDISLKTPLMNPKMSNFGESNGKIQAVQNVLQTTDLAQTPVNTSSSSAHTVSKFRSAISINHLSEYVEKLKMHNGLELSEEYESIESGMGLTWKHANMEENRPKNRYANVVAYDHSRVILTPIDQVVGSDYINANYIDGYQRPKAYIATQGPLPETFYDFWRMVWEQNSYVIVMMTKLEERARVKCDQYWPSRGTETFSDVYVTQLKECTLPTYTVTINETAEFAYYTLRTFTLKRLNADSNLVTDCTTQNGPPEQRSDTREIKHFQFTAWPDYGTPDHPQPLILFIRRVTQMRAHILHQLQQERLANGESLSTRGLYSGSEPSKLNGLNLAGEIGPTIVHCSAGVGRTGAFIVIDSQLERLRHEKSVDIFGSVGRMRAQRNFMVQTEQQYTFLYDVFVEATTVHGTEVTAHGLYNHVVKLRQTATTNLASQTTSVGNGMQDTIGKPLNLMGPSGLELEFKRLNLHLIIKKQFTTAILPENRLKNRSAEILPFESNRVCLPLIRGLAGSDYINASFVDGYRRKRAYIATQTPLPNTVDDFWRLIWEQNSPIIVLLNEMPITAGNIPLQQDIYWPMERSTRYQHLLVEPMVEYNMPHFILREFRLTDTRDGQSRTLRQFQLHGWPQDSVVPKSAEAMIDLIGQVHKTQTQFGQDGPITVHCSTGSGRSAVFMSLSLILERMRCEGMVDVFLTTRMLRTQRVDMIQTADQYAFCYAATLEYLASFDHYTS
ncbi:hypothetical protein AHF37_00137 [Paragonimus kellicotti]|nr:hypothetical protein AHF37_00137 [Paragonimus kellicotti]